MKINKRYILFFLIVCAATILSGCFIKEQLNTKKLNELLTKGNEALFAKQYDEAIKWYDAGLAINSSEPVFLSNKSAALRFRGAERFNSSNRLKDEQARNAGKESAKQDFRDAATVSTAAVKRMESVKFLEFFDRSQDLQTAKLNVYLARADSLRLVVSYVDKTKSEEALIAMREYIELEPETEKKIKMQLETGKMLIDAGRGDDAVAEYKKVLALNPDHIDAVLGIGLALSQSGDLEKYREAESYLQRFVDRAADNHPLKSDIKNTLEFMKQEKKSKTGK